MKTAISIPDELFESAEELAGRPGTSRGELYVTALQQYVQERSGERITERLNELYEAQGDGIDPVVARLQGRSFPKTDNPLTLFRNPAAKLGVPSS